MAEAIHIPNEAETRAKFGAFAFSAENKKTADMYIGRYPAGRQQSAVMALLDLAQRQVGEETHTQGWLPVPVIEYVASYLGMPYMRAYEVATFYTCTISRPLAVSMFRYAVQRRACCAGRTISWRPARTGASSKAQQRPMACSR